MFSTYRTTGFATVLCVLLTPTLVLGQTNGNPLQGATVDALARMFLACERAAITGLLSGAEAAQCSSVYEEFKLRAFGGDFAKLHAWWLSQQAARRTSQ